MSQPDPWNAPTGLSSHGQPQAAWGQPGGYGPPPQPSTNTMAILSLVFAFIFAPAGLVMGIIAKRQIRGRHEGGSGLATAGIVISAASILLGVLFFVLVVVGAALSTGSTA